MGRVFSYESIESGQVPSPEDFNRAVSIFTNLTELEVQRGTIDGSFIYGSVANGTPNYRSDLDTFIALTDNRPKYYAAVRGIIRGLITETNNTIPVVPIIQTKAALAEGSHELDRFFGRHLVGEHRIVQGNDPAQYMQFANWPSSQILAFYLFQKRRRLAHTYTSVEPLDVDEGGLQRMLELPVALGRKILQATAEVSEVPPDTVEAVEKSADKPLILDESRKLFADHGVDSGFEDLIASNRDYNAVLGRALTGSVGEIAYNDVIKSLHAKLPQAIAWLETVEKTFLPAFGEHQFTPEFTSTS